MIFFLTEFKIHRLKMGKTRLRWNNSSIFPRFIFSQSRTRFLDFPFILCHWIARAPVHSTASTVLVYSTQRDALRELRELDNSKEAKKEGKSRADNRWLWCWVTTMISEVISMLRMSELRWPAANTYIYTRQWWFWSAMCYVRDIISSLLLLLFLNLLAMKQRDLGRSSAAAADDRYVTALKVGSTGRCAISNERWEKIADYWIRTIASRRENIVKSWMKFISISSWVFIFGGYTSSTWCCAALVDHLMMHAERTPSAAEMEIISQ